MYGMIKIKILKCSKPTYWYSDRLNEEFLVRCSDSENHTLIDGNQVLIEDAEIVDRAYGYRSIIYDYRRMEDNM